MAIDKIVFDSPAARWEEALPLGNGRLGTMIFGSPDREKIQLNEDSIWSGAFRDRNNPGSLAALPFVRRLLDEGRIPEAEELCLESFSGIPQNQRVYQTAGDLRIKPQKPCTAAAVLSAITTPTSGATQPPGITGYPLHIGRWGRRGFLCIFGNITSIPRTDNFLKSIFIC